MLGTLVLPVRKPAPLGLDQRCQSLLTVAFHRELRRRRRHGKTLVEMFKRGILPARTGPVYRSSAFMPAGILAAFVNLVLCVFVLLLFMVGLGVILAVLREAPVGRSLRAVLAKQASIPWLAGSSTQPFTTSSAT